MSRTVLPLSLLLAAGALAAEDFTTGPLIGAGKSTPQTASEEQGNTHSWEMPPIAVDGKASTVRESQLIGSYGQPRWTARRLFTETRSYVIPEGQIQFEYWLTVQDAPRNAPDDEEGKIKQQYEVEMGLPYRFQVDLYQTYEKEPMSDGANVLSETKFEVRWAFADWDVIPLNPTAYLEWAVVSEGYDVLEAKLLLCDDITERLRWAANAVYEEETGGSHGRSRELTGGISYGAIDSKVAVGVETKFAWEDELVEGQRTTSVQEFLAGPSIQVRPSPRTHIDLAMLFGLTEDSSRSKFNMVAGWEF